MARARHYRHGPECPLCLAEAKMARIDDPVGEYRAFMVISAVVLMAALVMVALTRIGAL